MTCGHSTWSTFAAWFSAGALRDSGSRVLVGHNGNGLLLYTSYVLHVGFSVPWHTRPSGAVAIAGQGQAGEYCEPPASHLPWLCLPHDRLANQCKCRRRPGPQLAFQRVQTTSRALNKCRCDRQETLGGPPPAPPSQGKPMPTITGLRCVLERRPWWRRGVCPGGWGSHQVTAKTLETPPPPSLWAVWGWRESCRPSLSRPGCFVPPWLASNPPSPPALASKGPTAGPCSGNPEPGWRVHCGGFALPRQGLTCPRGQRVWSFSPAHLHPTWEHTFPAPTQPGGSAPKPR